MIDKQTRKSDTTARKVRPRVPPEHDADWAYTGAEHRCPECGHAFRTRGAGRDFCPECGASTVRDENVR